MEELKNTENTETLVTETQVTETQVTTVAETPVNDTQAVAAGGNGLAIAVLAIVILLIAAGGFSFYWFTRPIYKVNRAIEKSDYKTAVEYYDKISEEDKEIVSEQFLSYCESKKDEYVNEDIEYSMFTDEMEIFEDVLDDKARYQDSIEYVERLKESRNAWSVVQKSYDVKDYFNAYVFCDYVIEEDKNYAEAQEMRKKCQNLMVVGEWVAEADLTEAFAGQVGMEPSEISFAMKIIYEFDSEGNAILRTDTDYMKEQLANIVGIVIEKTINTYCEAYGVTVEEMDELFENFYGMSFNDYIKANMDMGDLVSGMDKNDVYTYVIEGSNIILTDEDGKTVSDRLTIMENGTISLNSDDVEAVYEELGVELPLIFERQ